MREAVTAIDVRNHTLLTEPVLVLQLSMYGGSSVIRRQQCSVAVSCSASPQQSQYPAET